MVIQAHLMLANCAQWWLGAGTMLSCKLWCYIYGYVTKTYETIKNIVSTAITKLQKVAIDYWKDRKLLPESLNTTENDFPRLNMCT